MVSRDFERETRYRVSLEQHLAGRYGIDAPRNLNRHATIRQVGQLRHVLTRIVCTALYQLTLYRLPRNNIIILPLGHQKRTHIIDYTPCGRHHDEARKTRKRQAKLRPAPAVVSRQTQT